VAAGWWVGHAQRKTLNRNATDSLAITLELKVAEPVGWRRNLQATTSDGLASRGTEVLAAAQDSPWFAVAKIDREEAPVPLSQRELAAAGFVVLALATIALAIGLAWREQTAKVLERELKSARQEAARRTDERWRETVANLAEGFYRKSMTGTVLYHNREYARILGFAEDESLVGRQASGFWQTPESGLAYLEALARDGCVKHYPVAARKAGGEPLLVEMFARLVSGDGADPPYIEGAIIDVTEREQADAALRASEAQLRRLTQAAHVGLYEWNVTRDRAYWSPEVYRLFGLQPGSESGLGRWLGCLDPAGRERARRAFEGAVDAARAGRSRKLTDVYRVIHSDGSAYWLEATGQFEMTDGELILRGAVRDVTDRKRAEEALEAEKENLERRVRERTAQLEHANKELESFTYSVSHDLRAPLRAIDGFTRILADEYGSLLDEEGNRLCSIVRENTRHMGALIDDLLAFSRLDRAAVNPSVVDMHALARSTFDQVAPQDARDRIAFELGALPPAYADPALIRQVWVNLLENAVKFSSKRERAVIEVWGESAPGECIYSVRDNGAGFDPRYGDKLFGVFQRLHSVRDFAGTGVGLALVQRVIHRHGGRIWAEGEPDRGAVFRFTIPQKGASQWSQEH
jgi:PAS domain S-box-containing protein